MERWRRWARQKRPAGPGVGTGNRLDTAKIKTAGEIIAGRPTNSMKPDQTAAVIHCCSFCFGAAPTWREAIFAALEDHQSRDRHHAVFRGPSSGFHRRSA